MASYNKSLHFQSPDLILKEAVSRTTRYRLHKKRKMMITNSYESLAMDWSDELESTYRSEELQSDALEVRSVGDSPEPELDWEVHGLIHASTDSARNQEYANSSEKRSKSLEAKCFKALKVNFLS